MFVCICNKVNESQITEAVSQGADSLDKLESCLGVGSRCGKCKFRAHSLIKSGQQTDCDFYDAAGKAVSA